MIDRVLIVVVLGQLAPSPRCAKREEGALADVCHDHGRLPRVSESSVHLPADYEVGLGDVDDVLELGED